MLDQSFSEKNLKKLLSFKDFGRYNLGKEDSEIVDKLNKITKLINKPDYHFSTLLKIKDYDNTIFKTSNSEDEFALRKLNDNLKKLYKFKQANRNLIINQIISLLNEEIPMSIVKLDIRKFYESIQKEELIKKLTDDPLLSYKSKQIFNNFISLPEITSITGLPRGINISSALSEILMRDFDKKIAQMEGVYYYARYVDDMIIFTFQDPLVLVKKTDELLHYETGLKLNCQKTKIIQRQCRCTNSCKCNGTCICSKTCKCKYDPKRNLYFEYLGYRFVFSDIPKSSEHLIITLSKNKINKLKTRIILSFFDFISNNDINLLEMRIKFLTSNFILKRNKINESLNAGIYYNHPHINNAGLIELDNLTIFLRKTINSKSRSFGNKLSQHLTTTDRLKLSKYNFRSGFLNRKLKKYSTAELMKIKKCWIYE